MSSKNVVCFVDVNKWYLGEDFRFLIFILPSTFDILFLLLIRDCYDLLFLLFSELTKVEEKQISLLPTITADTHKKKLSLPVLQHEICVTKHIAF